MLVILIEIILNSLDKGANYFVSLQLSEAGVFNTAFSGVTGLANSSTPYWGSSNWAPFLIILVSPLINKIIKSNRLNYLIILPKSHEQNSKGTA